MCPATSGRFWPLIRLEKSRKLSKNRKKRAIFRKNDILFYSGRKYDIWPEIGPLDPRKPSETLYWPSYLIWLYFKKSQKKIAFFISKISIKMFFRTNILADVVRPTNQYRGSIDHIPAPICIIKNSRNFPETHLFRKSVVFVALLPFLTQNFIFAHAQQSSWDYECTRSHHHWPSLSFLLNFNDSMTIF